MFVKRIKFINNKIIQAYQVTVDPSMRLIAIYDDLKNNVQILTTITLLNYFNTYRQQYQITNQYSLKSSLKSHLTIQFNSNQNLHLFKFSEGQQKLKCLCCAFFSGSIKLINPQNGGTIYQCYIQIPILRMIIINQTIYLSAYNFELICIEKGVKNKKDNKVSLLIKQKQKQIFQDIFGNIIDGNDSILIQSLQKRVPKKQKSYQEFLDLQQNENAGINIPLNYQSSPCNLFIFSNNKVNQNYLVYSKQKNWNLSFQTLFKPYINPFQFKQAIVAYIVSQNQLRIQYIRGEVILTITNFKDSIRQVLWIGPIHILAISQNEIPQLNQKKSKDQEFNFYS